MPPRSLRFRLVNVFAEDSCWSGNALAVIEDARDLSDEEMQAIALQFNLSETTFVLPSATATACVRIFTPSFEMPFAGHPTLGTAQVVSELGSLSGADRAVVTLEMRAGIISVEREGEIWTLCAKPPTFRASPSDPRRLRGDAGPRGKGRDRSGAVGRRRLRTNRRAACVHGRGRTMPAGPAASGAAWLQWRAPGARLCMGT